MTHPPPHRPAPIDYATPHQAEGAARPSARGKGSNGLLGWLLFIGLAVMLVMLVKGNRPAGTLIRLDAFADRLGAGQVASVVVEENALAGRFSTPQAGLGRDPVTYFRVDLPRGGGAALLPWLLEHRGHDNGSTIVQAETGSSLWTDVLLPLIPWLLIFGFIWFFVFRQLRNSGKAQQQQQQPVPVMIVNPPNPPQPADPGIPEVR